MSELGSNLKKTADDAKAAVAALEVQTASVFARNWYWVALGTFVLGIVFGVFAVTV